MPSVDIDWESWVGVRGAALLGGIVLALAGLYFFQYSIEHGLIPPWLRVTLGTLAGLACIVGSEWKARERYETTANALVGAGVVILYSAVWAARVLYELIGFGERQGLDEHRVDHAEDRRIRTNAEREHRQSDRRVTRAPTHAAHCPATIPL